MNKTKMIKLFEERYKESVSFDSYLGMDLAVNEVRDVTYQLTINHNHLTTPDSAHCSVAAAMMDAALSYAVSQGNFCTTVEFKINFMKQVKPVINGIRSRNILPLPYGKRSKHQNLF